MSPESAILILAAVFALAIAYPALVDNPRTRALKRQRARLRQSLLSERWRP